jgi:hypothetical protein
MTFTQKVVYRLLTQKLAKISCQIKICLDLFIKGGLTILKELKIAHHENSVPKKDFFSHFSTPIFEFKAKSDIEK